MAEVTRKTKKQESAIPDLSQFGKIPPQAMDIEEAVLGSMMLNQNALNTIIDQLTPAMFYKESHARIFSAIQRLFSSSSPIDILTVTNELKKSGDLDIVGGPFYIASLTNRVSSAANIEFQLPAGTFYFFPKVPHGLDDVNFVNRLQQERILAVPGSGFGYPGFFRLALCVDKKFITAAKPGFIKATTKTF